MSTAEAFNYKKVSESVCTAGLLSQEQLDALHKEGYQAVINLLPEDSQYALPGERECIEKQGLSYHYIPVAFDAPQEHDYNEFAVALSGLQDKKTVVHCAANYRVSAFYAIYAHRHLGWSEQEAREHIAAIWNPSEYPPWEAFVARMLQGNTE